MKTIDKLTLQSVIDEVKATARNHEDVRRIVSAKIALTDLIPAKYANTVLKLTKLMYDPADKGRNGKHLEAADRIEIMVYCEGAEEIPFREFFAHKHDTTDLYDHDVRTGYEKKTGTGDWLYFEEDDFDACIRMYARKRTKIRWDYVREDKGINIHIETSYRKFFKYLEAYNPDKGLATWFVKSSRTHGAGMSLQYIWKMQEIMTSKKKIAYLNGWKG